jgi:hypothetical protein
VLTTLLGPVTIGLELVRTMKVQVALKVTDEGLVLRNTFDSKSDVEFSQVGPAGVFHRGTFVTGLDGNALSVGPQDIDAVTFPAEFLNGDAGCIEFDAKLQGFPAALPWGQNPVLLRVVKEDKGLVMLHYNGNDGGGFGGLCVTMSGYGRAATGGYGDWTYARALGAGDISGWHHYALLWDRNGLRGVGDGTRKLAIFVDGKLNSQAWRDAGGEALPSFGDAELRIMTQQHWREGRLLFDNLRVWNHARR